MCVWLKSNSTFPNTIILCYVNFYMTLKRMVYINVFIIDTFILIPKRQINTYIIVILYNINILDFFRYSWGMYYNFDRLHVSYLKERSNCSFPLKNFQSWKVYRIERYLLKNYFLFVVKNFLYISFDKFLYIGKKIEENDFPDDSLI